MIFLHNFLVLLLVHYLADYPLQGDYLAKGKNRFIEGNQDWLMCMFAHCMIHGLLVFVLTGSIYLFLVQFITHFVIDDFKCQGVLTYKQDQLAHIGVMAFIAALYTFV